jgi:hypothetical protein
MPSSVNAPNALLMVRMAARLGATATASGTALIQLGADDAQPS